jgi:hypothetical protein
MNRNELSNTSFGFVSVVFEPSVKNLESFNGVTKNRKGLKFLQAQSRGSRGLGQ